MVTLHKPYLYDKCTVVEKHKCSDGIARDILQLPVCLEGFDHDSTHTRTEQIEDRLENMRLCLVWYSQIKFPHQPHINYIEQSFDGILLHCDSTVASKEAVLAFAS